MNELSLFTGVGGGLLGSGLLGWIPVCAVEKEQFCREVLLRRQRDGMLPLFPIWDDIRTFSGAPWRGKVDIITAGLPCQPFSVAGKCRREDDERNMWPETARVISETRPTSVLLENVPGIRKYLPVVVRDLRELGYTVKRPITVAAAAVGAGHIRKRIWIFAHTGSECVRIEPGRSSGARWQDTAQPSSNPWFWSEPGVGRSLPGVAHRVDRLRAIGNGQVPAVVVAAWNLLRGQD